MKATKEDKNSSESGLSIQPREAETLTKEQIEFNRLLDRMKNAELKMAEERIILDALLAECISKVYPVHQEVNKLDFQIIEELYAYFSNTPISSVKRRAFIQFILDMIEVLIFAPNSLSEIQSARIDEILESLNNSENSKKSKKEKKQEAEELFAYKMIDLEDELYSRGYKIDLSSLNSAMSEKEIQDYIAEKIKNYSEADNSKSRVKKEKKKSKKQLEAEERQQQIDELKSKGLSSIYKSLAKILHPDLEQDHEKKLQKEDWMKRLTVAYEKKDLKTLLEIELEWAVGEKDRIQTLTSEKLALYNDMLRAQAQEMETQAATISMDKKYNLLSYFANGPLNVKRWRPAFSIKSLEQKKRHSEIVLEILERKDKKSKDLIDRVIKNQQMSMRDDWS